jgi:hypothetical protein
MSYDVLAAKRQRLEASGAMPWPFTVGDEKFSFPPEPPAKMLPFLAELAPALDAAAQNDAELPTEVIIAFPGIVDSLLGDDADRFNRLHLSIQDISALIMTYFEEAFGGGPGESAASPGSSPREAKTQRQTSKRTTKSTSATTTARRARATAR